ncbi:hypothetical protein TNCV_1284031 [Trichonephila clavipes]|uniref:Uncharacterized protein n=1 Tax=Trichonephila clavipes TaxID=2585209 RepID=A0A8X6VP41_TRICX|nr:hypothetical protein TNCV_1284031 [Trichonephila clavipes]
MALEAIGDLSRSRLRLNKFIIRIRYLRITSTYWRHCMKRSTWLPIQRMRLIRNRGCRLGELLIKLVIVKIEKEDMIHFSARQHNTFAGHLFD